jgi:hypothetical protein
MQKPVLSSNIKIDCKKYHFLIAEYVIYVHPSEVSVCDPGGEAASF